MPYSLGASGRAGPVTTSVMRSPNSSSITTTCPVRSRRHGPRRATIPGMEQRISLITLGVADLRRAMDFYAGLGWEGSTPDGHVAFFQAGEMVFGLWGRGKLAEDSGVEDGGGWGGVTLAYNCRTREEVDAVLAQAEEAGGRIGRRAGETFYGGYSGIFVDPDGHPWEVAQNPSWTITESGGVRLPPRS